MRVREIKNNIDLARTYKYISQLEMEKSKRANGVKHDMTDIHTHYKNEIDKYDFLIDFYTKKHRNTVGSFYNCYAGFVFLIVITILLLTLGIF